MMRYRPNNWPLIPMFVEVIRRSKRLPADYDMSHMLAIGAGCEAFNNKQLRNVEEFLKQHNCNLRLLPATAAARPAPTPLCPWLRSRCVTATWCSDDPQRHQHLQAWHPGRADLQYPR